MTSIFFYVFLAIGLSMDGFSLAVAYGTNKISKNKSIILSLLVGIFHFIMPNIGSVIGHSFLRGFLFYSNIITGLVFLFLAIQMSLSLKEEEDVKQLTNFVEMLFFALAVSIDSFSLGIVLSLKNNNLIIAGLVFMIISCIFTLAGLILGKYLGEKTGKISKIIGILILIVFSVKYLFNL